jgi:hypothetical protein
MRAIFTSLKIRTWNKIPTQKDSFFPQDIQRMVASYCDCMTREEIFALCNLKDKLFQKEIDDEEDIQQLRKEVELHQCTACVALDWDNLPHLIASGFHVGAGIALLVSLHAPVQMYLQMWWYMVWLFFLVWLVPHHRISWICENVGLPAEFTVLPFLVQGITWFLLTQSKWFPYVPSLLESFWLDTGLVLIWGDVIPRAYVKWEWKVSSWWKLDGVPHVSELLCAIVNRQMHAKYKRKLDLISGYETYKFSF